MAVYDNIYRKILAFTRFFSRGWGPASSYESLLELFPHLNSPSETPALLAQHTHPITTTVIGEHSWGSRVAGSFRSPLATLCPHMLPDVATEARFELLLPKIWSGVDKPIYIHLAGTGDHGLWRRRHMTALPLLREQGIGALLLENPYYGSRKPQGQRRSQLNYVSDLFVMGLALIFECLVLIGWLEGAGYGPVGLTGISMGGHNASLAACVSPHPVPLVPCLSWSTGASAFTEGLLSASVCWDVLIEQLEASKQSSNGRLYKIFQIASGRQLSGEFGEPLKAAVTNDCLFPAYPAIRPVCEQVLKSEQHREAVSLLLAVLNCATHFNSFRPPLRADLTHFITAREDQYIPRHSISHVQDLWPGCHVQYINGGHVSSAVTQQAVFRNGLSETMTKLLNNRVHSICS